VETLELVDADLINVEEGADYLGVRIPRVSSSTSIQVIFDAQVLVQSTQFTARVFDTNDADGIDLPQPVLEPIESTDDPNPLVGTNSLQVLTSEDTRNDVLKVLDDDLNRIITPNGDTVNDELAIRYDVLQLLRDVPNRIDVYDLSGRRVSTSVEVKGRGQHTATWNGRDDSGELVPVGLYVVRVAVEGDVDDFEFTTVVGVVY
jgi:hypothetical protein